MENEEKHLFIEPDKFNAKYTHILKIYTLLIEIQIATCNVHGNLVMYAVMQMKLHFRALQL